MFLNNLLYEIKLLARSYWLVVLLISISCLFTFATLNGNKNVTKRLGDISKMQKELHKKDSAMLATLTKIEKGEKVNIPYWQMPSEPSDNWEKISSFSCYASRIIIIFSYRSK